ncbi:MAG: hypothetical protein JRH20_11865 [Deltaproteobacteria bacterium]|nr:hypothetical protein [Deltaproteobacteria bacterium]
MPPQVLISRSASQKLFAEVRRWVEVGLAKGGSPLESLVYPLSALVPKQGLRTPVELLSAEEISEVVIDEVAVPPDDVKVFSAANCHFAGDLDRANAAFNADIDRMLGLRPRLGLNSKLHAHPFVDGAFLSPGDIHHGVNAPKAVNWRERRGLRTAILHVVYPDATPRRSKHAWQITKDGAKTTGGGPTIHWRIRSWASMPEYGGLVMRDLGDARVVSGSHPSVRAARRKPYWCSARGARWCDAQKSDLRNAGYPVSRNLLGRGWRRYLVQTAHTQLLIALPPDYPALAPRLLDVKRAWRNEFEEVPLPRDFEAGFSASLLDLVRRFGAPPQSAETATTAETNT